MTRLLGRVSGQPVLLLLITKLHQQSGGIACFIDLLASVLIVKLKLVNLVLLIDLGAVDGRLEGVVTCKDGVIHVSDLFSFDLRALVHPFHGVERIIFLQEVNIGHVGRVKLC